MIHKVDTEKSKNEEGEIQMESSNLEEIIQTLRSLKEQIKENYKAEIIGIFGSYARREEKRDSDLDIIVRFEEGATLFDLAGLSIFLREKLDVKVDVVSDKAIREELKDEILKEAISI